MFGSFTNELFLWEAVVGWGEGWWVKLDGLTLRNGLCELGWEYKLPEIRENQACSFMGFG